MKTMNKLLLNRIDGFLIAYGRETSNREKKTEFVRFECNLNIFYVVLKDRTAQ